MDLDFKYKPPTAFGLFGIFLLFLVSGFFLEELAVNDPASAVVTAYRFSFAFGFGLFIAAAITRLSPNVQDDKLFIRFFPLGSFDDRLFGIPRPIAAGLLALVVVLASLAAPSLASIVAFDAQESFSAAGNVNFNTVTMASAIIEDLFDFALFPTIAAALTAFGFLGGFLPILFLSFFWLSFEQFAVVLVISLMIIALARRSRVGWKPNALLASVLSALVVAAFFAWRHGLRSGFDLSYMFAAFRFRLVSIFGAVATGSLAFPLVLHGGNNAFAWAGAFGGVNALLPPLALLGFFVGLWVVKSRGVPKL